MTSANANGKSFALQKIEMDHHRKRRSKSERDKRRQGDALSKVLLEMYIYILILLFMWYILFLICVGSDVNLT